MSRSANFCCAHRPNRFPLSSHTLATLGGRCLGKHHRRCRWPTRRCLETATEREVPAGLGPLPLLQPFQQCLAAVRCNPARAMAFGAKPRATWKPARHTTATLADRALVICPLSIGDHAPEYTPEIQCSRESTNGGYVCLSGPAIVFYTFGVFAVCLAFMRPSLLSRSIRPRGNVASRTEMGG